MTKNRESGLVPLRAADMLESDVQLWLDRVADCFFADDFEGYSNSVSIPFVVTTPDGKYSLETEDALRGLFESWRDMLTSMRVTHMIRTCRSLEAFGSDLLECHYETQLLSETVRVTPTYSSVMKLERSDETWRAVTVVSDANLNVWPVTIPRARAAH